MENPEQLKEALLTDIAAADDLASLDQLRVRPLGITCACGLFTLFCVRPLDLNSLLYAFLEPL